MYISVDLGGTNTRVASSKDLKNIISVERVHTEQNVALEKKVILDAIGKLSAGEKIERTCIGIPGMVNKKNRKFNKIPNVPSLTGLSYEELFNSQIDPGVLMVENDAALAGLGEAVLGAGKNYDVVAYLTLGTGVGGVRISGKMLDAHQNYSEPGHMIIQAEGHLFKPCGQHGCLESYISGSAFRQIYGISPSECVDQNIWDEYAQKLALGIINVLAMWGPDVVILGGSISNKFEEYFKDPLMDKLSHHELFTIPPVVKSALGDDSGIYGGLVLMSQTL